MAAFRYRGIPVSGEFAGIAKHLDNVNDLIDELKDLQSTWSNLSLLGELTHIGAEISNTREDFKDLSAQLTAGMLKLSLQKVTDDLANKAQCSIDILVRNLFERTADIGFLVTDTPLVEGCKAANSAELDEPVRLSLVQRLRQYIGFYSVYRNAVLLDRQAQVILDAQGELRPGMQLGWIPEKARTRTAYVEQLARLDPEAPGEPDLIYAWTVQDQGITIGYVALAFNLANEGVSLFDKILGQSSGTPSGHQVCGVLNQEQRVLMSSDPEHIRIGQKLNLPLGKPWGLIQCGPTVYLACQRNTRGYQGYMGPGWSGFCIVPLMHAFSTTHSEKTQSSQGAGLKQAKDVIDPELNTQQNKAVSIQNRLNQSVWNGNIVQGSKDHKLGQGFTKTLLWEISRAGDRTRQLFQDSLDNLSQTTLDSTLQTQQASAMLAIDLMDRNLYERANDCRWWALNPVIQAAAAEPDNATLALLAKNTLETINGLYTVYASVLLLDADGRVLCSSRELPAGLSHLNTGWHARTMALTDPAHYEVSAFEPSPLYGDRPTYIYCAPVFGAGQHARKAVGCIALVFDSEPQFEAILQDSLVPVNGTGFGFIVDQAGHVIASTTDRHQHDGRLNLPIQLSQLTRGDTQACLAENQQKLLALGLAVSSSYREYKAPQSRYQNTLTALYGLTVGEPAVNERSTPLDFTEFRYCDHSQGSMEVATFRVADTWYGLPTDDVIEAFLLRDVARSPNAAPWVLGCLIHKGKTVTLIHLEGLLHEQAIPNTALTNRQAILLKPDESGEHMALLVDELGEIPNIPVTQIDLCPELLGPQGVMGGLVKTKESFLHVLDRDRMLKAVNGLTTTQML